MWRERERTLYVLTFSGPHILEGSALSAYFSWYQFWDGEKWLPSGNPVEMDNSSFTNHIQQLLNMLIFTTISLHSQTDSLKTKFTSDGQWCSGNLFCWNFHSSPKNTGKWNAKTAMFPQKTSSSKSKRVCIYIYIHTHIYIYIYVCVYVYVYIYICICIYVYMQLYAYMYIYMHICMQYVYIYIYTCVYIYIYIYTCVWHISCPIHMWRYAYTNMYLYI